MEFEVRTQGYMNTLVQAFWWPADDLPSAQWDMGIVGLHTGKAKDNGILVGDGYWKLDGFEMQGAGLGTMGYGSSSYGTSIEGLDIKSILQRWDTNVELFIRVLSITSCARVYQCWKSRETYWVPYLYRNGKCLWRWELTFCGAGTLGPWKCVRNWSRQMEKLISSFVHLNIEDQLVWLTSNLGNRPPWKLACAACGEHFELQWNLVALQLPWRSDRSFPASAVGSKTWQNN